MFEIHSTTTILHQRMEEQEINILKLQQAQMAFTPPGMISPELQKELDGTFWRKWLSRKTTKVPVSYRPLRPTRNKFLMLFGIPLFNLTESPWTILQGNHVMKPGQCWPMSGSQGFLVIALSHPITISHVTLDHLPCYNHPTGKIDSAPKDFLVYGTSVKGGEKILLVTFTYDKNGDSSQTFQIPSADNSVFHSVELPVLNNWGNQEYTYMYCFRVHGQTSLGS